jgi:hypothetical protein
VAISLLLLIGAGLFVRSLSNLQNLNPGFVRESVLLVNVSPQSSGYKGQRLRDYYETLLAKAGANPEVRAASLANITPLSNSRWNQDVSIQGYQWKPDEKPYVDFNAVSPRFFETLGIPIIAGRLSRQTQSPSPIPPTRLRDRGWSSSTKPWPNDSFPANRRLARASAAMKNSKWRSRTKSLAW